MASYESKYSSNFYNIYNKYVEVDIRKKDYVGGIIALRNVEVYLEVNYQDNNTPIFGTGASIVIINEMLTSTSVTVDDTTVTVDDVTVTVDNTGITGAFDDLYDLLTSAEKDFWCVITYDGTIVFQGFSICDLNEQQFIQYSRIKLQFTDYLRRAEDYYFINLFLSGNTDLLEITNQLRTMVGFDAAYELYVNSTLFEANQNSTATDTFLKQTYVENNMFFTDTDSYDNLYDMVNKVLKPFGAFFYSCGDKWIIERQEDINRVGNWVKYNSALTGSSVASLKQTYNKQDGDFKYVDTSQILEYASGLNKLYVNLKEKQRDTFVFNDYIYTDMLRVSDISPNPGTLELNTWYAHDNVLLPGGSYNYLGMSTYVKWSYPPTLNNEGDYAYMGLYYEFEVQFPSSPEEPVMMNINFKMSGEQDLGPAETVTLYYAIRVDGGSKDGMYLMNASLPAGGTASMFLPGTLGPGLGTAYNSQVFDVSSINNKNNKVWSLSQSWNFTDDFLDLDESVQPSLWDQLGNPTKQKFMIYFVPSSITFVGDPVPFYNNRINYLGDIEVTVTAERVINEYLYYINTDFIKTEEVDMEFLDLDNPNYANGLLYGLGGIGNEAIGKTSLWTTAYETTPSLLVDIYAQNKYRNYSQTVQRLKAMIMHDGHMKPFSVITDDQRSGVNFILQGYTWDLFNGTYDIVAEQYTEETIIIQTTSTEYSGETSSEDTYEGDPGVVPGIPGSLIATQPIAGLSISVSWGTSAGATGYILQRTPYLGPYNLWTPLWATIYEGSNNSFIDAIQNEMLPDTGMAISYQVLALTTEVIGSYSGTVTLNWTNI
jgi:hypothetical protein